MSIIEHQACPYHAFWVYNAYNRLKDQVRIPTQELVNILTFISKGKAEYLRVCHKITEKSPDDACPRWLTCINRRLFLVQGETVDQKKGMTKKFNTTICLDTLKIVGDLRGHYVRCSNEKEVVEHLWSIPERCPYVAKFYHVFQRENAEFVFLMKRYDCTLEEYFQTHSLNVQDVIQIVKKLLLGLDFLHRHNITHMDIKPPNILMKNNRPVYSDFDLSFINTIQVARGTRAYCAPETLLDLTSPKELTNKVDVYGLGCVINQIVTKVKTGEWDYPSTFSTLELAPEPYIHQRLVNFLSTEACPKKNSLAYLSWWMMRPGPLNRPTAIEAYCHLLTDDEKIKRLKNNACNISTESLKVILLYIENEAEAFFKHYLTATRYNLLGIDFIPHQRKIFFLEFPEQHALMSRVVYYNELTVHPCARMSYQQFLYFDATSKEFVETPYMTCQYYDYIIDDREKKHIHRPSRLSKIHLYAPRVPCRIA